MKAINSVLNQSKAKHNEQVIEHDGKFNFLLTSSVACQLFTDIYVAITNFHRVDYDNTTEERPRFLCLLSPAFPPFAVIFLLTHLFAPSPQCKRQEQACFRDHDPHRRTGRGGRGGLQSPRPQILGSSDFLGSNRNLGEASFQRSLHVSLDIFYFNLKSVW